jgi:opacity protein-like surface antigen
MIFRNGLAALVVLGTLVLPPAALAQMGGGPQPARKSTSPFELTAIAGYQVNTDIDTSQGSVSVGDTEVFGAALGYEQRPGYRAELVWLYSEPMVRASGGTLTGSSSFPVSSHYFQLGGTGSIRRQALEPFAGLTLGAALYMPGTPRLANGTSLSLDDTWRFAFTLAAGLKVHVAPKVALRFETRVAAPVYFDSGAIYVGGGSAGMSVSGGIPLWQWNFLGGLVYSP